MVEAERPAAVLALPSCAGVAAVVLAGLAPPSGPVEAGAAVAGAVVVAAVVEGAVVDAGLENKPPPAAGVVELVVAVVVAGFAPNRLPVVVDVAGAVVAGAAPPNRLGVAVADDAAGAVVVVADGNSDLLAAGVESAGAPEVVGVAPAAIPNSGFAPVAGAAVAGVLAPVVAAVV
jgi:hypothetical protein